jgi:F-type H+-transporting ATPase subunit delta
MADALAGYAEALLAVAGAEGDLDKTKAQMAEVGRAIAGNEELRSTLSNRLVPADVRGKIVDELLANKTTDTVRALVGMIVSAGRGGQLSEIVDAFIARAAASSGKDVAVVRSAVALTDDQQARLAAALEKKLGSAVELQLVIDPTVVGGAVTTIGDTVIDGSLRSRLTHMREAL